MKCLAAAMLAGAALGVLAACARTVPAPSETCDTKWEWHHTHHHKTETGALDAPYHHCHKYTQGIYHSHPAQR